ncbi:nucleoside phosphorylase domain-containing protein [Microdochium trichocladiopsis]|uniref:Nucleoside phosphorylase domain-containing protein n=1 Tax=Microdochium trichocladiopsis TaxID=1682393 RepID=A0A9P9BQF8_9PEZI|nr:nucleoside phosphorylase domain-containing protein [Microdochium trichocladiopsis]KAH7030887.1 nucleoside phosphorylase domain-containing protein [Microdochium trichocladiopsis]
MATPLHPQSPPPVRPSSRSEFEIAIVCALPLEFDAVCLAVDEFWDVNGDSFGRARGDQNLYTTGRIGNHNVVLALLPGMGKVSGASTAANLRHSYTELQLVLLVGICGGVPSPGGSREVLLGDVVVSQQVVQFDFGRQYPGRFITRDDASNTLGRPDRAIRTLLATLQTEHGLERLEEGAAQHLASIQCTASAKGRAVTYGYPGIEQDRLFPPGYFHKHHGQTQCLCHESEHPCPQATTTSCKDLGCDVARTVRRQRLYARQKSKVFVGNVGSGDTVMKSGLDRDRLAYAHQLIAFEMEGAGMWDELPCVVVKGVCDYADSHKDKVWQPFAAAAAAAATKAVLRQYSQTDRQCRSKYTRPGLQGIPPTQPS